MRSSSPIRGVRYPENIFKTSSPTKKLEKKFGLLILRGERVQLAKKNRMAEVSK